MRKNIFLLFMILCLFSFYTALNDFESKLLTNTIYSTEDKVKERTMLIFKGDFNTIDSEEFLKVYKQALDATQLNAYHTNHDSGKGYDNVIYVYSQDSDYINKLTLRTGEINNLKEFSEYSTISLNKDHKLFKVIKNSDYCIRPFDANDPAFFIEGSYSLTGRNGEITSIQLDEFKSMIQEKFPKDILEIQINRFERHNSLIHNSVNLDDIIIILLIVVIASLIMNSSLFIQQRNISIMKLEGHNNFEIYFQYYFKHLLWGILGYGVLSVLGILIILPLPLFKIRYFLEVFGLFTIINIICVVLSSFILFGVIIFSPLNTSMKGKNQIKPMYKILVGIKFVLIGLGIFVLVDGFEQVRLFSRMIVQEPTILKRNQNLYRMALTYYKGNAGLFSGTPQLEKMYDHLSEQNNSFSFQTRMIDSSKKEIGTGQYYYMVDRNYIIRNGLIEDPEFTGKKLFIPKKYQNNEEYIKQSRRIIEGQYYDKIDLEITFYDKAVPNYNQDYFYSDLEIESEVMYYVGSGEEYKQFSNRSFTFEGSLSEAQSYIDQLFIDNGMKPSYGIVSGVGEYQIFKAREIGRGGPAVIHLGLFIMAYLLLNKQIIEMDIVMNRKQYFLEYLEGSSGRLFFKNTFINNIDCCLIAFIVIFVFFRNNLFGSIMSLSTIVLVECIYSYIIHKRHLRHTKWRDLQ